MISNFNEEAQEIIIKAKLEMLELKHPYVGTEHLVLAILHTKNDLTKRLEKYNLTYNRFKKEIINIIGKGSKKSEFFLYTLYIPQNFFSRFFAPNFQLCID